MKTFKQVFATDIFGKWHLGDEVEVGETPNIPKGLFAKAMEAHQAEQETTNTIFHIILNRLTVAKEKAVSFLRNLRKQEKDAQENLCLLEKSATYFEETGNFGPLSKYINVREACSILGCQLPTSEDQKLPS